MSSQERTPAISNSPFPILVENESSPHLDLTGLMRDFPVELRGINQALHIPPEEMTWQLRRLPLKGYSACFIVLSSGELLGETEIFTYWREAPRIFLGRVSPEGEIAERFALGHIKEKENPWGPHYNLKRSTGIPIITRQGNIHHYSAGARSPQRFPCIVQAARGPVFQMTISRSERKIRGITSEHFNVCAFDPGLASEIWEHLRSKSGFLERFH